MCLATLAVVFMGGLLWLRWPLLSSPLLQLRRFWTPGPGGPVVWCKWLLLRLLVPLCRRRGRFDLYSFGVPYDPRRCGLLSPEEEASLDDVCAPADKDSRWSHDEQLLWSSTESGECVVARVRRQPSGSAQAWLYVRTADGHCYVLPPEQRLYADESLGGGHYSAGGLRMERMVPMRRWRIAFNGLLRCTTRGDALVHVQIGLVRTGRSAFFITFRPKPQNSTWPASRQHVRLFSRRHHSTAVGEGDRKHECILTRASGPRFAEIWMLDGWSPNRPNQPATRTSCAGNGDLWHEQAHFALGFTEADRACGGIIGYLQSGRRYRCVDFDCRPAPAVIYGNARSLRLRASRRSM